MTKPFTLLLLFCLALFTACQSDSSGGGAEVAALEQEVAANGTPDKTQQLINEYITSAKSADANAGAEYLQKAAALHAKNNRFSAAVDVLKQAIKNHYSGAKTPENIVTLAKIFGENLRSPESAMTAIQAGANAFKSNGAIKAMRDQFPADLQPLEARIESLANRMYNDSLGRVDFRIANDYMTSGELYALIMPNSPEAVNFLAKAGETARSIRNFPKALEYYNLISEKYPDSDKAPQAMFLRAFTLDNDLKKPEEARPIYEAFLQKYPNDDFADDTKFLLENLGKSDDEIIESFNKK